MAAATAVISVPDLSANWKDGPMYMVAGTVAIGASPATYTSGGIVMSLANSLVKSQRPPKSVTVTGQAGYIYKYVPGTSLSNGLLMIFAQTASASEDDPLGELANAVAIPAACSSDTVGFTARFLGMN